MYELSKRNREEYYLETPITPVEPNPPVPLSDEFSSDSETRTTKIGQRVG